MVRPKLVLSVSLALSLTSAFLAQAQTKSVTANSVTKEGQSPNSTAATSVTPVSTFERNSQDKPPNKTAREDARRYYKAGVKYGRANLFRQALQSFQEALKHDPEYPEALYGLGRAHLDLGHYSEAIDAFQTAIKLNPKAADAYAGLGEAYAKLKDEKQASQVKDNFGAGERVALAERPADRATNIPDRKNNLTDVYKVGAGDVLDIRIAGTSNQESTLFTVSSTGTLEYPLLGQPLNVIGLTTNEISENIGAELRRRAVGRESDPQVGVRDYNSHTILVSGLVKEPGTKILRREAIPLYVVLADAQPLPEASQVTVISQHSDKAQRVELSDAEQTSMLVLPGDVVSVGAAARQFFYVGGEVKAPGEFSFHKGLSLTQAIFAAGGVTYRGERIQLSRGAGDGLLTLNKFKLKDINNGKVPDPLIEPGDRITVLH
jgi:polysaccharide export outer membrane protein